MADMVEEQQNVLVRLTNLPLVSSTYDKVSSAYVTTKDNHPYLKSVCDVAETSVKNITSVAMTSAEPILQRLEPQIALANNLACAGLDKLEEKLPILHQPSEKVVAKASEAVVGAKDAVFQRITGAVDKTKGAVQDGVEKTKAVVSDCANAALESSVVKMMSHSVDAALSKSETLLEQYLPPTDEELVIEATKTECFEAPKNEASYYVRLGSLSTKARKRAYQQALTQIKDAKCRSQEAIAQLQITVDLIEYARKNLDDASQKIHNAQEKIYNKWVEWTKGTGQDAGGDPESYEHIESSTLAVARSLGQRLQSTCLSLLNGIQGLPQDIQKKAQDVSALAADVYQNFQAASFREMTDGLLSTTKEHLTKMKAYLDDVVDYLVKNTPLNWLVAFYPQQAGSQEEEQDVDGGDCDNKEA
ncbi:Perilipin family, partial [Pristimantis euphronides]